MSGVKGKTIKYVFHDIGKCNMCQEMGFQVLGKRLNKPQGFNPKRKTGICATIVKCKNCGLIFANPQPIPDNINDHYGIPPENYWKEAYFDYSDSYLNGFINYLKKIHPHQNDQKLLDVGFGLGKALNIYQNSGYQTYGIEPSSSFYKRAIENFNFNPEQVFNCGIEEASFEKSFFDIVIFSAVLEHLYNPDDAIKKALTWLKPGGIIFITVPSANWLTARLINTLYRFMGADYVTNLSPMHEPYHLYEFTLKAFEKNALINNYKVINHQYNICDSFFPKPLDPIIKQIMRKTDTGMEISVTIKKNG